MMQEDSVLSPFAAECSVILHKYQPAAARPRTLQQGTTTGLSSARTDRSHFSAVPRHAEPGRQSAITNALSIANQSVTVIYR